MLPLKEVPGFRIGRVIGAGGMSTVYEAVEIKLNRPVALKVLHPFLLSDRVAVERFRREALAAAKLDHPNIVRVYDYLAKAEYNIIVMEYVPGLDLYSTVKAKGRLAPEAVFYVMHQVALSLKAAHGATIIHRDIKPSNILIHRDRRILLTDFGLARHELDPKLTTGDAIAGTPQFMSPEQIAGGEMTAASDIFSWAVSYYFALLGKLPYSTEEFVPLVNDIRAGNLHLSHELRDLISPLTFELLSRCLLVNPAERPRNGSDLLARMTQAGPGPDFGRAGFMKALDAMEQSRPSLSADKTMVLRRPKRSRAVAAGLAAFLVLAALLLGALAYRNGRILHPPGATPISALDSMESEDTATGAPPKAAMAEVHRSSRKIPASDTVVANLDSGQLFIYCEPWAQFVIDGTIRGTAPMSTTEMIALTEGKHVLTLYRESFSSKIDTVEILKGKIVRKRYSLERNP